LIPGQRDFPDLGLGIEKVDFCCLPLIHVVSLHAANYRVTRASTKPAWRATSHLQNQTTDPC
jgi:hypothetical protein